MIVVYISDEAMNNPEGLNKIIIKTDKDERLLYLIELEQQLLSKIESV